jgi:hypothetical protein
MSLFPGCEIDLRNCAGNLFDSFHHFYDLRVR